jgi:hypothetical protein
MDALAPPLPLRLLIDEALKYFRAHFFKIYFPVAIPVALLSGLLPLAQMVWFRSLTGLENSANPFAMLPGLGAFLLVAILVGVVSGLGYTAVQVACVDAISGRPVSMSRAWLTAVRPRVFGTLVLSWLAMTAGLMCCILPGLYVALLFCVVVPVMVAEGTFGTDALGRSYRLMTYNPQQDFGADPRVKAFLILFVGALLGWVLGFLVTLPLVVVQQIMVFRNVAGATRTDPQAMMQGMLWLQIPTQVLATMARLTVSLYVGFGIALLFFDLRRRREGMDLEAAIGSLSPEAPDAGGV